MSKASLELFHQHQLMTTSLHSSELWWGRQFRHSMHSLHLPLTSTHYNSLQLTLKSNATCSAFSLYLSLQIFLIMAESDSEEGLTREEMQQQEEVEPPPKRAKQDACTFISSSISSPIQQSWIL